MFITLDPAARAVWERECGWDPAWDAEWVPVDDEVLFESVADSELPPLDTTSEVVAARLAAVREHLSALSRELPSAVGALQDHELVDVVETLQQAANIAGLVDQVAVAEIDRRGLAESFGATSTLQLLRQVLRVRPAEAKRRVAVARSCAPRVGMTGEALPALREQLAAAQATGDLSTDHAAVIASVLDRLPVDVPVDELGEVEQTLVDYASRVDPTDVATFGRAVIDMYDPDGPEPRDREQRRRRSLRLSQSDSGMGALRGDLTAGLLAKLQAVLSPLAAPRPADANGEDLRSADQRMHDALEEVCDRLLRSGTLPDSGGVPATVAVTIPLQQLEARTGRVTTHHGGDLSMQQLLDLACEAEIIPVVLNDAGGILAHGRSKRLATPAQTKALHARDKGCCFPGCDRPPEWTQRHHVIAWLDDGLTDIDNLALLCSRHHHEFQNWGWSLQMIDGIPWWTPPAHLDPEQKLVRNTAHDVPELADLSR